MSAGRWLAAATSIGTLLLAGVVSAPLSGCCRVGCSDEREITVHGLSGNPTGSVNATAEIVFDNVAGNVVVSGTSLGATCTLQQLPGYCYVEGTNVTIDLDFSVDRPTSGPLLVIVSDGSNTRAFFTIATMTAHKICGATCVFASADFSLDQPP